MNYIEVIQAALAVLEAALQALAHLHPPAAEAAQHVAAASAALAPPVEEEHL